MHYLASLLIGITTLVGGLFGHTPNYGTTVTTVNGTDTLSSSRTTLNNNFTALLNGKLETTVTSIPSLTTLSNLVTVGTLTSGALGTGFMAVNVAQGGTGSTTLSANQVLLGNGTSLVKTVSGWGTSGQSLVSNGAGLAPSFQSVSFDQTGTYNNTGPWTFATSTTYIANFGKLTATTSVDLPASVKINGVQYAYPSTQGAAQSVQINDGSGNLSWGTPISRHYSYASTTSSVIPVGTASSSPLNIPAGILNASSTVTVDGDFTISGSGNGTQCDLSIVDTNGNTYVDSTGISIGNIAGPYAFPFHAVIVSNQSTSAQYGLMNMQEIANNSAISTPDFFVSGTQTVNWALALGLKLKIVNGGGSGSLCTLKGFIMTVTP